MITMQFTPIEIAVIRRMARVMEQGGRSNIREGADRDANLGTDQLTGAMGEAALHKYWYSDLRLYMLGRVYRNMMPRRGDDGMDITPLNVDVKTSLMRAGPDPLKYNLSVRPKERRAGWVYILGLRNSSDAIHLVGWYPEDEITQADLCKEGVFAGSYVIPAKRLYRMMPLRHIWTVQT